MRYMVLIYSNEQAEAEMTPDQWAALMEEHNAFGAKYGEKILAGDPLDPTSTGRTIRRANGEVTVMDGPYAETKEQLGGYYTIEAASMDEAVAIASDLPLSEGSAVEVRSVMKLEQ